MIEKYQNAATAYQDAYVNNMSGFDIIVELYKGMIKNLELAKAAYSKGDLEEVCHLNEKTSKILIALQSHLDFDQGKEAALFLNNFYNNIFVLLSRVFRQQHPEEQFDHILSHIKPVYEIWCMHAKDQKDTK